MNSLRNYDVEIGVVGSQNPGSDMHVESLGNSAIVAVAARDFLPKPVARIGLKALQAYPLILREKGSKTRQKLEEEAAVLGIAFQPAVVVEGREAMLEVVAAGIGIGFVSESELGNDPRLVRIGIDGSDLSMAEALIHLKQRGDLRIIRAFMSI